MSLGFSMTLVFFLSFVLTLWEYQMIHDLNPCTPHQRLGPVNVVACCTSNMQGTSRSIPTFSWLWASPLET
jgi:hypothetical protein